VVDTEVSIDGCKITAVATCQSDRCKIRSFFSEGVVKRQGGAKAFSRKTHSA